ncbi:MAG: universal stress protein [Flavihumibacter sp.]|nr:universal stress protein [Flavihumibacter sp.]
MKKFLLVLDGFQLSMGTVDFAIRLAKLEQAQLVGLFPEEPTYRSFDMYRVIMGASDVDQTVENLDKLDEAKREEAVRQFQSACEKAGITFSIHRDKRLADRVILEESTYADLLIICKQESFLTVEEEIPSVFLQKLMASSFCPVLVVPPAYQPVDEVFILYDGKPSSVFAAKHFRYILPGLAATPKVQIITVHPEGESSHLPNNKLMRDFVSRIFPNATYTQLRGSIEEQIKGYVRNNSGNELLVVGAYRRSDLSRWFKSSMADVLIKELNNPVFIAHH